MDDFGHTTEVTHYEDSQGYKYVYLYKTGSLVPDKKFVHMLLAEAFIPNPKNKTQVEHINGVTNDNRLENLKTLFVLNLF